MIDPGLGTLYALNVMIPINPRAVGRPNIAVAALASHPVSGMLYATDGTTLYEMNTADAQVVPIGPELDELPGAITDMVFDDSLAKVDYPALWALVDTSNRSELWAINLDRVMVVDPNAPRAERIGTVGIQNYGAIGLPCKLIPHSRWYTIDRASGQISTYDVSTAAMTAAIEDTYPFDTSSLTFVDAFGSVSVYSISSYGKLVRSKLDAEEDEAPHVVITDSELTNDAYSVAMHGDANLDGLIDVGERPEYGHYNYAVDTDAGTPNDGGPASNYPFNRRRLVEDTRCGTRRGHRLG